MLYSLVLIKYRILKYLEPEAYYELAEKVSARKGEREAVINQVIAEVKKALDDFNIKCEIMGRSKHFYSIYRKMKYQHKQLDEIFDLTAIRVIVESVKDCCTWHSPHNVEAYTG